jgi:hypothetical protein
MDLTVISETLDDEFVQLKPDGRMIGKEEIIKSYSSGGRTWEIAKSKPLMVKIIGETGLLYGKWTGKGMNNDQKFDYTTYFLAVYRKRDEKWQLVGEVSIDQ